MYDMLGAITKDEERGKEYPPMTIMEHKSLDAAKREELFERTTGLNALPMIYPISAGARDNANIAVAMKDVLQKRMFHLLIEESSAGDYLVRSPYRKEYMDPEDLAANSFFIAPYVQTSLFINECINLEQGLASGLLKLTEPGGQRKDRYTAISYGNYFASILEQDLLMENENQDIFKQMMAVTQAV